MTKKLLIGIILCIMLPGLAVAQNKGIEQVTQFLGNNETENAVMLNATEGESQARDVKQVKVPVVETPTLLKGRWSAGQVAATPNARKAVKANKAATLPASAYYAEFDYSGAANKTAGGIRRIARLGTDSMQIFNLGGFPDTIVASYDAATGTATLRPQLVYNHATYGPIWFCKVDYDQKVYDNRTTATIGGQVDDKGNISIGGWGLFVVSGQYKGYAFAAYSQSDFYPSNATANATIVTTLPKSGVAEVDSTTSYPVYIYQTADNEATIMNFANTGNAVNVMLNADKSVDIAPQVLFTNAVYGNFMGYAADIDNAKYMLDGTYIKGTGTEQSIKLGNWSIGIYSSNMLARVYRSTEFNFNSGIVTYPAAKALDWSGTGTEADPYVIATPAQLEAFAESVNLGTSYKDKYVKLGADIDMAGRPGKWRPAGMYDGKSFDGILDGDNHTISHVSFEQGNMPYSGIIGNAGAGSVIKNLTADSVTITTRGDYASCIVGYSAGTLTNLKVTQGYVKSYGLHSGLVVGYLNEGAIDNCTSAGYIAGYGATGGVAGYVEKSNLTACSSSAKVEMTGMSNTLYRGVGGVVGDQVGGQLTESYFAGTLNDKIGYSYAGGVIGSAINDTIDRCYNAGVITTVAPKTSSYSFSVGVAGGVVGMTSQAEVTNCYNSNLVMDTKPTEKVGGIVGYVSAPSSLGNWKSHFYNCYNSGQVLTPSMTPTQGIYGYCKDFTGKVDRDTATFFNCYYDVQVNGYTAALNVDSLPAHALLTASMTSTTALDGLSTDNWVYTSGLYPRLKGMETTQAAKLSASPMLLTHNETSKKVKYNFTVSTSNSVVWKALDSNGQPTTETDGLSISGRQVTLKHVNGSNMLVASNDKFVNLNKIVTIETVNPAVFAGSGTKEDPYKISNHDDLMMLSKCVSEYAQNFMGDYFIQTNDIDLNYATDFVGVGDNNSKHIFDGQYDGQGYTIYKMRIDSVKVAANGKPTSSGSYSYGGFIRYLGSNGVLKNLNMGADCKFYGWSYVAPFVGMSYGAVQNCHNYANVTTMSAYAAGIVGYQQPGSSVSNCYNAGNITSGGTYAAGIVAYNKGKVTGCQNDGNVAVEVVDSLYKTTGFNYASGISCANYATADGDVVVSGNVNTGTIKGENYVSGIFYNLPTTKTNDLSGNLNYGIIECANTRVENGAIGAQAISDNYTASSNNYYDGQLAYYGAVAEAPCKGVTALSTAELTSGKALAGLSGDDYDYVAGQYPVRKQFKDEARAVAQRKMVVTLAAADNVDDVTSAGTLYKADSLVWTLAKNSNFTIDGQALKVAVANDTTSARDTLTASLGGYNKVIALRAMPNFFEGKGTSDDPYQIKTVADMQKLARLTNVEKFAFNNRHFKVMNDIDFTGVNYTPVSEAPVRFNADFDGNGKTFSNVTADYETGRVSYVSLFKSVGSNGNIHDLTIASGKFTGYDYTSSFASQLWGTLKNCVNKADVLCYRSGYAAGIAAMAYMGSRIIDCKNYGSVTNNGTYAAGIACDQRNGSLIDNCENHGKVTSTKNYAGGIVSASAGNVSNCTNYGAVSGASNVAGIVAYAMGNDSILYCSNQGKLTSTSYPTAGILAGMDRNAGSMVMIGCHNDVDLEGEDHIAGVAGQMKKGAQLIDCYNTGNITGTDNSCAGLLIDIEGDEGYTTRVTRCYNTGDVIAVKDASGFACDIDEMVDVDSCYNTGNVLSSGNWAGGFAASLSGTATDCWNSGNVESSGYGVAGFAGIGTGTIVRCYNLGDITSSYSSDSRFGIVGGIYGYGRATIKDCYNMGTLTANQNVGGIAGSGFGANDDGERLSITNCYNAGKIVVPGNVNAGNIVMRDTTGLVVANCYYDSDVNPTVKAAAATGQADTWQVTALPTSQLVSAALGEAWALKPGMYPTLAANYNELCGWYAAVPVLAQGDTPESVTQCLTIGTPDSTVWTSSSNLYIDGNTVYPTSAGEAWLTKTFGQLTKTYTFNVTHTTGVTDVNTNAAIVRSEYIGINGVNYGTERPTGAGVYIKRDVYSNGTSRASKILVK